MMDIFRFSAAEMAGLLGITVGVVKEGLKRACHRLHVLAAKFCEVSEERSHCTNKTKYESGLSQAVFGKFLFGFRSGDPEAEAYEELLIFNALYNHH